MFQNLEWPLSMQTNSLLSECKATAHQLDQGCFQTYTLFSGREPDNRSGLCVLPQHCRHHITEHTGEKLHLSAINRRNLSFQTLSSEEGAASSRLTPWSSGMDHTWANSHTPGSSATLVKILTSSLERGR